MSKNYIIFYNNNNMIFPVKAEFNPHVQGNVAAFCAGSPQFFGGTQEGDETVLAVLGREVAEESINTYSIQPGYATLFYEQRVLNPNNNRPERRQPSPISCIFLRSESGRMSVQTSWI